MMMLWTIVILSLLGFQHIDAEDKNPLLLSSRRLELQEGIENAIPDSSITSKPENASRPPGPEPEPPLSSINPRVLKLLHQVDALIPGFGEAMEARFGLTSSQIKTMNNFVEQLMNISNTNPQSLSDLLASLQSSGLFEASSSNITRAPDTYSNKTQQMLSEGATPSDQWSKCQADITMALQGLSRMDSWALQMLDATAKPGSGILKGNFEFLGNYKECQDVWHRDPVSSSIVEGNICRASIKLPIDIPALFNGMDIRLKWHICFPKSCLDSDLNLALMERMNDTILMTCTKELDISDDNTAIVAVAVLSLLGVLLLTGTIVEMCVGPSASSPNQHSNGHVSNGHAPHGKHHLTSITEPNGKPPMMEVIGVDGETKQPNGHYHNMDNDDAVDTSNSSNGKMVQFHEQTTTIKNGHANRKASLPGWQRALLAFSIPRNTEKILSVKSAPGTIGCLHGIRVLSMAWVILGHVISDQGLTGQFENSADVFSMLFTFTGQMILNAPLAVDTFFVMSGLLTCYLFLKTLGKKGKITLKEFVLYYVHRYWRLTPPMLIWIMVVTCLKKYLAEGRPVWDDVYERTFCQDNWWITALYINNIYKQENLCLGVTWFLANDMQFYVVAPLALIPWVYGKKFLGFLVGIVFVGIHIASTIWLEIKYNGDILRNQTDYTHDIYFKPYTRVAPFAIGLMAGWVLWKTKCQVRMNKCMVFLGWFLCLGLILTLTLVTYDENKDMPMSDWTKAGRVAFETCYRPGWALAICWLIFACATGHGGYVNSILSWGGWLPLSRLTYSVFLVHVSIIAFEVFEPEYRIMFTLTSLSYSFIGFYVMAHAVGYLLSVAVESPMLALEKVALG